MQEKVQRNLEKAGLIITTAAGAKSIGKRGMNARRERGRRGKGEEAGGSYFYDVGIAALPALSLPLFDLLFLFMLTFVHTISITKYLLVKRVPVSADACARTTLVLHLTVCLHQINAPLSFLIYIYIYLFIYIYI